MKLPLKIGNWETFLHSFAKREFRSWDDPRGIYLMDTVILDSFS